MPRPQKQIEAETQETWWAGAELGRWCFGIPFTRGLIQSQFHFHLCVFLSSRLGFPGGTSGKEPACQFRRHDRHEFDPWVRRIPWRRRWFPGNPFQYSRLENPVDRGAWEATVHGVTESQTRLSTAQPRDAYLHTGLETTVVKLGSFDFSEHSLLYLQKIKTEREKRAPHNGEIKLMEM